MSAMRSKDVAALAAVSVRTLRHYHQVGILPEPDRSPNGYRRYTLAHVGTLLRIRRLVALGVSLDQVPAFLGDEAQHGDTLLEDLERELAARVDQLQEQRDLIALLRAQHRRPDLPPGLDTLAVDVAALGSDLAGLERDASLVLARLSGDGDAGDLHRLGAAVHQADQGGALTAVARRYQRLAPESSASEAVEVAEEFVALLGAPLVDFLTSSGGRKVRRADVRQVPAVHGDPRLNGAQVAALRIVGERLDALAEDRDRRGSGGDHHPSE